YRVARVLTFLNPGAAPEEATWQVKQSLVGIGAGRLFGVGLGQGQQKLGYLPYAYSDFIFSTIGEEWGFIGVLVILALFGTFVWLGFRIGRSGGGPFAQALRDAEPSVELLLVGARRGIEAELLPRQPFRHRLLSIEPIYRRAWWRNARWLWLAPRVWRDVGRLLREERPAIVIGTGGYA